MKYDVYKNDLPVGCAEISQTGLYYKIRCSCKLPDSGIYKIQALTDEERVDLGICIPENGIFRTEKIIPIKHLHCNNIHFQLIPKDLKTNHTIIPISADVPFTQPEKIKHGKFNIIGDSACIFWANYSDPE